MAVSTFTILASTYMTFISLATIIGNGMVIASWIFRKEIRSPGNLYLVSLAVVDFITGLCQMPLLIGYGISVTWPFGSALCFMYIFNGWVLISASVFHLIAIAIDRYQLVYDGPSYIQRRSFRSVLVRIAFIWIFSFWQMAPTVFAWDVTLHKLSEYGKCASVPSQTARFHIATGVYYIPVALMSLIYLGVYKEIQRRIRKRILPNSKHDDDKSNNSTSTTQLSETDEREMKTIHTTNTKDQDKITVALQKERKAAKTIGIVCGAFVLSWAPFFIMYPTIGLLPESLRPPPETFVFVLAIGFSNSAMNPIIYTFYNLEFRAAFRKMLIRR